MKDVEMLYISQRDLGTSQLTTPETLFLKIAEISFLNVNLLHCFYSEKKGYATVRPLLFLLIIFVHLI